MRPFALLHASEERAAGAAMQQAGSMAIAGGTTVVDLLRLGVLTPARLVDVSRLALARIELDSDGARVGAMVRNADLAAHDGVAQRYPLLREALLSGASPQIRHMATTGGNLLQRTRCAYYRDVSAACDRRAPGSGCAALAPGGDTRQHAVLGGSDRCIAVHPSDMSVALLALDAIVHTRTVSGGQRAIALDELHVVPGEHPERETVLEPGELIVAVTLPPSLARQSRYVKARDRASYAFALASCGATLRLERGVVAEARVALGGVATKPWRARAAEAVLVGHAPSHDRFVSAAKAALAEARPVGQNAFKVELARRVIVRALETVSA